MTSLITSQRDVKVGWLREMDTDSAYMSKSQYMQSNWFSNKSNINIIYNISVMTITITIIIILANFGKYAISDCLFICLLLAKITILASMFVGHVCLFVTCQNFQFWQVCSFDRFFVTCQNVITCQNLHFGKYVRWSCLYYHFGKYVGWSCLSVCVLVCLSVCTEISQNLKNDSLNHHQTWSQASTSPWFLQVRWTRM